MRWDMTAGLLGSASCLSVCILAQIGDGEKRWDKSLDKEKRSRRLRFLSGLLLRSLLPWNTGLLSFRPHLCAEDGDENEGTADEFFRR